MARAVIELSWGALGLALVAWSCAGAPEVKVRGGAHDSRKSDTVQDGELALAMGDPGRAVEILEGIGGDDPMAAYANELLRDARAELDAVYQAVLAEADRLIERDMLNAAAVRLDYLEGLDALGAKRLGTVGERRESLGTRRDAAIARLRNNEQLVKDYLMQNDLDGAQRVLRESREAAADLDPDLARVWVGIANTIEVRRQAEAAGAPSERTARARRRATLRSEPPPAAAEAPPAGPSGEELARAEQLKQANATRERGAYFDAIVAFREILARDPASAPAKNALKDLEAKRQELVRSMLDRANRYFLRQDLAGAAPYYRRVLQIDPDNARAKEGLRMHENLERIRQEAKDK